MKLADIFETRIEEKIDPVIKVGEVQDEAKLASEGRLISAKLPSG